MPKQRDTFHLPASVYHNLEQGDFMELSFTDDMEMEYQNARNQTYKFNMLMKPKKFGLKRTKNGTLKIIRKS